MNHDITSIADIGSVHFVGIKGVAMTALSIIAKQKGLRVTGSDTEEVFPTDEVLQRFGISSVAGFSPRNVPACDLVVYTGAHKGLLNVEVEEAKRRQIPVLSHGKALGLFMKDKKALSVAGSHGKTTTSALIAFVLNQAGWKPSFAIGCGEIMKLKTSAAWNTGDYFVAEADEYVTDPTADVTPRFLWQNPYGLLITNVDFDHPDVYKDIKAVKQAFTQFVHNVVAHGIIVVNADDPNSLEVVSNTQVRVVTYGLRNQAAYMLSNVAQNEGATRFSISEKGRDMGTFRLSIPGEHNALNALGAYALLREIGVESSTIQKYFPLFTGTKRRFELIASKNDKLLYDDYAHHPAEIAATIAAARSWYPKKRILVIFQPHTFSRTKALLTEFAAALSAADIAIITDIYASARESKDDTISGKTLCDLVDSDKRIYAPEKADVLQYLRHNSTQNDLILSMGAGSIYTWLTEMEKNL